MLLTYYRLDLATLFFRLLEVRNLVASECLGIGWHLRIKPTPCFLRHCNHIPYILIKAETEELPTF